jgi:hypothetical protein
MEFNADQKAILKNKEESMTQRIESEYQAKLQVFIEKTNAVSRIFRFEKKFKSSIYAFYLKERAKEIVRQQKTELEILRKKEQVCGKDCGQNGKKLVKKHFEIKIKKEESRGLNSFSRQKLDETIKELNEVREELSIVKRTHEKTIGSLKFTEHLLSEKVTQLFLKDFGDSEFGTDFVFTRHKSTTRSGTILTIK